MEKEIFSFDYNGIRLMGDIMPSGSKPKLLILHGAGTATRARYDYLRNALAEKGISSAIFEFLGHGETGGDIKQSSLESRTKQAAKVIEKLGMDEINILGSSMGGYNAIKLLELLPIKKLILMVPAVYNPAAYKLSFDPTFSKEIRNKRIESDAWEIISKFQGNLLIFYAGKDGVIPREVPNKIYESAQSGRKEIIEFPEAEHLINQYLESHPEDLQKVINKIVEFLS